MHNFRSFIQALEDKGDVVRITKEVDPKFEIAALMVKLEAAHKAFIFENVKGAKYPLVGGLFSGLDRFALAHNLPEDQPFSRQDHAALMGEAIADPLPPKTVNGGAVKDVVVNESDVNLSELPIPTFFEDDSGAFITAGVGVTRNPSTGQLNVGFYRCLILDDGSLSVNASSMSDLRGIYTEVQNSGEPLPIAIVIGASPALLASAAGKPPPHMSEYDVAGALQGSPMELVKCETNDLLVPADAEIVIEGIIDFKDEVEQTLGEFAGQYGPETDPITKVTTITHRKDAMFYALTAGANPEHNTLGTIAMYTLESLILKEMKAQFPAIKNLHIVIDAPMTGTLLNLVVVMDKKRNGEPAEFIREAFKSQAGYLPVGRIFKRIVVVDDDVNIYDHKDVEWAIATRMSQASKILVIEGYQSWELDRGAKENAESLRLGYDATKDLEDVEKLKRPIIPGAQNIRLEDYL